MEGVTTDSESIHAKGNVHEVTPNTPCDGDRLERCGGGAGGSGGWRQVGPSGAWQPAIAGAVLNGRLYKAETNGGLYETVTGTWRHLGKPEFASAARMFAKGDFLYTIKCDGSLYRVGPSDGGWPEVGPAGAWKPTIAGAVLNDRLYTAEDNGGLYATNLDDGGWVQRGASEFGSTKFLFAKGDSLTTIETDGSLYQVFVK
jgi:hypothetical protein